MRRVVALICAAAVVGLAATAPPAVASGTNGPNAAAERLCKTSGGTFLDLSPLAYACLFPNATTPQRRQEARRLCVNRDPVVGFVDVSPLAYACVLPGRTQLLNSAQGGALLNLLALLRLR